MIEGKSKSFIIFGLKSCKVQFFFSCRRKDFGIYKVVKPGFVSEKLHVPQSMECPSYVTNVYSPLEEVPKEPEVKSREDIWEMRKTCLLARLFLDTLSSFIEVNKKLFKYFLKLELKNESF